MKTFLVGFFLFWSGITTLAAAVYGLYWVLSTVSPTYTLIPLGVALLSMMFLPLIDTMGENFLDWKNGR